MSPIHIDETTGSDATGTGAPDAPYQTLAYAVFKSTTDAKFLTRKDASAPYDEPTQSALKKAKKGAEGLEKKRKKAEELAEKAAAAQGAESEKREKQLEESKKIVLSEDAALPTAIKVCGRCILTEGDAYRRAEQDREPGAVEDEARAGVGLGAPFARPEGHQVYHPSRRDWVSAGCPLRQSGAWRARAR